MSVVECGSVLLFTYPTVVKYTFEVLVGYFTSVLELVCYFILLVQRPRFQANIKRTTLLHLQWVRKVFRPLYIFHSLFHCSHLLKSKKLILFLINKLSTPSWQKKTEKKCRHFCKFIKKEKLKYLMVIMATLDNEYIYFYILHTLDMLVLINIIAFFFSSLFYFLQCGIVTFAQVTYVSTSSILTRESRLFVYFKIGLCFTISCHCRYYGI